MSLDRNKKTLSVGDMVCWFTGTCFGKICELRSQRVHLKWNYDERMQIHVPADLIKITESEFAEFLETADVTSRYLGQVFCRKFKIVDQTLKLERCPGRARKRIIEWYAEHMA